MFDSTAFWENRYASGGNSGCGSYNNLAKFKADIINKFLIDKDIQSVIDYGVGDGNQLKYIDTSNIKYTGLDVSQTVIQICEDLCGIEYPLKWHKRCFDHQQEGIFRSDEEWKFIFESMKLNIIDVLNIRCERDREFSDPYKHIYRIQYLLENEYIN